MSMWRKIKLLGAAVCMSLMVTACGGPSESKAGDFAVEIIDALFQGDINPMLENFDYSGLTDSQQVATRELMEGKLKQVVAVNSAKVAQHGGVDSIEVKQVKLIGDTYNVDMIVKFNDETSQNSKLRLRWSEDLDDFVIVNK